MIEIVISILLLIGGVVSFVAAIGVIRFPDVYSRLHAASKSSTLGVIAIMIGVFLYFLMTDIFIGKILLAIFFVFLTAPVSGFMISRAAYNVGVPLSSKTNQDDLARDIRKSKSN